MSDDDRDSLVPLRPPRSCPECAKPADRRYWPFCSRRCADLDLHRWLSGHYRIAGGDAEDGEGAEAGDGEETGDGDGGGGREGTA